MAKDDVRSSRKSWWAQTEEESVEVVSRFVEHTIYAIIHARNIIPSESFEMRDLGCGCEVPCLHSDCGKDARTIQSWVRRGLRPAIAKRYLKSATLVIADGNHCSREQYTFRLSYPTSETVAVTMSGLSSCAPRLPTRTTSSPAIDQLRRTLVDLTLLACGLSRLNDAASIITMRLSYTSLAPPGFNPPHFQSCTADALSFADSSAPVASLVLGTEGLITGFHTCRLVYKGPKVNLEESAQAIETASDINNPFLPEDRANEPYDADADAAPSARDDDSDDETRVVAGPETLRAYGEMHGSHVSPPSCTLRHADYHVVSSQDSQDSLMILQVHDQPGEASNASKRPLTTELDESYASKRYCTWQDAVGADYHVVSSQDSQVTTFKRYTGCREPVSFTQPGLF